MRVHWLTDYEGVANSFGYHVHNARARQAVQEAGVTLDDSAPVAVYVGPPHRLEPVPGKKIIAYVAWEASELPALFARTMPAAHSVAVSARFLVEPFQRLLPDKTVEYVPEGVDGDVFTFVERRVKSHPFRFLWVGAPNARKGLLHVLQAWRAFCEGPGARWADKAELYVKTSLGADSKVRKGVIRQGNIIYDDRRLPIEQLVSLYHRAHAFVFPSIGEGFGLTMGEAMATGLPVIYTPWTSLLDLAPVEMGLGYPVKFKEQWEDWSWTNADANGASMEVKVRVANADVFDLAKTMLYVATHAQEGFEKGCRAAEWIRGQFVWNLTGGKLVRMIEAAYRGETRGTSHGNEAKQEPKSGQVAA